VARGRREIDHVGMLAAGRRIAAVGGAGVAVVAGLHAHEAVAAKALTRASARIAVVAALAIGRAGKFAFAGRGLAHVGLARVVGRGARHVAVGLGRALAGTVGAHHAGPNPVAQV